MPLRMIEIVCPAERLEHVRRVLEEDPPDRVISWTTLLDEGRMSLKLVVDAGESEDIMDAVMSKFGFSENYRLLVYPVEATLPRLEKPREKEPEATADNGAEKPGGGNGRISREEMYHDVEDVSRLTGKGVLLAALSGLVAALGLMRDSEAVIIGAMVIAPLLGPNVGVAFGTALGDSALVRRGLAALAAGALAGFLVTLALGLALPIDTTGTELSARTRLGLWDLTLALASGVAGILSFTMGQAMAMVGVMVALALMPPVAAAGLFLGSGHLPQAGQALLLFTANVVCLNLAGVVTFLSSGVRPATWWEAEKAKRATGRALLLWTALLAVLIAVLAWQRL